MNELQSNQIMRRLREAATASPRAKERLATLDRLEASCNAICEGKAASLIERYLPEARARFRHTTTVLRPDRVEEYVRARRNQDAEARRLPSSWTGPTAVTLRKDKALGQYVKVRAAEQESLVDREPDCSSSLEAIVSRVVDSNDRAQLRLALGRTEEFRTRVTHLERVLRAIEPLRRQHLAAPKELDSGEDAERVSHAGASVVDDSQRRRDLGLIARLISKLMNGCDGFSLERFGLEYDKNGDRVLLRKLRHELVAPEELVALRRLATEDLGS